MAEKNSKVALEKINEKLECSICMESYTDPKLLPCFHVFCMKCLEPLVVQDHNGLSLQCPVCRHSIQLPPKGVSGLQSDFHVDHLFEIRDALEKVNLTGSQKTKCEKCEEDCATGFCRDCGEFICDTCTALHRKWKQFKTHEIVSPEEVQTEAANLIRPKKQVSYCPRHTETVLKIFCETCSKLICNDCTIKLHQGHNYDLVTDTFPKHKDEITASLEPVKQQLSTVSKTLCVFEERVTEIEDQRVAIEAAVHKEINLLQQTLEQRKTELISKLDRLTQLKLKNLAAQRDQVELVQVKLSSCVDYVEGGLKTGSEGEVLAMKAPVLKRIQQITADFNPATKQPEEEANLELTANNKQDLQQACRQYGEVEITKISPENSYAQGEGLERATAGEESVVMVTTLNTNKQVYTRQANLTAELVHCKSKATVDCDIQQQQDHKYKITYQPTHRGKHELHIKINGKELCDSPYTIAVTSSPQSLGRPVRVIGNLSLPYFATTNGQNQILVTEWGSHQVSILSPQGTKISSFGRRGSAEGEFNGPTGITQDDNGNIYVADCHNHRIQKFTSDGKFIKSVGTFGRGKLQFHHPNGVFFHPNNDRLYVCDSNNDRLQLLRTDLTYDSTIGREGKGNGEFKFPVSVGDASSSNGNVIFVTDLNNHRIQVFDAHGKFLQTFTNKGQGTTLEYPWGIAIDSNNTVYVSERDRDCISVFSDKGEFITTFGNKGQAEGQFNMVRGLCIDKKDCLLACDMYNGRIQIF